MTPSYYEEVTGAEPEYNCILFQTDESFSKEEMEEAGEKIVARDEVLSVSYMHDIEKQLDDMLGSPESGYCGADRIGRNAGLCGII